MSLDPRVYGLLAFVPLLYISWRVGREMCPLCPPSPHGVPTIVCHDSEAILIDDDIDLPDGGREARSMATCPKGKGVEWRDEAPHGPEFVVRPDCGDYVRMTLDSYPTCTSPCLTQEYLDSILASEKRPHPEWCPQFPKHPVIECEGALIAWEEPNDGGVAWMGRHSSVFAFCGTEADAGSWWHEQTREDIEDAKGSTSHHRGYLTR